MCGYRHNLIDTDVSNEADKNSATAGFTAAANLICVTNKKLCQGNFLERIEALLKAQPAALLLREKELSLEAYAQLAEQVQLLCQRYKVLLILQQYLPVAIRLQVTHLQLSMPDLRRAAIAPGKESLYLGASVHSLAEAVEAVKLGASYLVAGHIYTTACKKGLPPRGLAFLQEICRQVVVPVFAIGGIKAETAVQILQCGAKGMCVMSGAMSCDEPVVFVRKFYEQMKNL